MKHLEQKINGAKQKSEAVLRRISTKKHMDEWVEEADKESFPASDPPSWTLGTDNQFSE